MSKNGKLILVFVCLVAVGLACSGSSDIEVNPPDPDAVNTAVADLATQAANQSGGSDQSELGTVRSNPAPAGSEILANDMAFVVTGSVRPATDIVIAGNQFNESPEGGQEYVLVSVQITCKLSTDETCSLFSGSFKLLGSAGIQYDPNIFLAGVDGLLDFSNEFYGGAIVSGYIPFIVGSEETGLLLVYEQVFGSTFYLAIE